MPSGNDAVHRPAFSFGSLDLHYLYRSSGIFVGNNELIGRTDNRKTNEGFGKVAGHPGSRRVNRFVQESAVVLDRDFTDIDIRTGRKGG